ncbi:MAG: hypothetical protein Q7U36_04425 [bacterium]|nr:hypothetical protein [bacterium]
MNEGKNINMPPSMDKKVETGNYLDRLQELAVLYNQKKMPENSEDLYDELRNLVDKYKHDDENRSEDEDGSDYYNNGNTDVSFMPLPNGLYLEFRAHTASDNFYFSDVLTKDQKDARIDELVEETKRLDEEFEKNKK